MLAKVISHLCGTVVSSSIFIIIILILSLFLNKKFSWVWRKFIWLSISIIMIASLIPIPVLDRFAVISIRCFPEQHNFIYPCLILIWIIGAFLSLRMHMMKLKHTSEQLSEYCEEVESEDVLMLFEQIKLQYHIESEIPLYICERIHTPRIIGFIQPEILLPTVDYSKDTLEHILSRELIAIKHFDRWFKVFLIICKCIFWFNPLVYIMASLGSKDIEFLRDQMIVKNMSEEQTLQYDRAMHRKHKAEADSGSGVSQNSSKSVGMFILLTCIFVLTNHFISFRMNTMSDQNKDDSYTFSENTDQVSNESQSDDENVTKEDATKETEMANSLKLHPDTSLEANKEVIMKCNQNIFSGVSQQDKENVKQEIRQIHFRSESMLLYDIDSYAKKDDIYWDYLDENSDAYKKDQAKDIEHKSGEYYINRLMKTKEMINNKIYSKNIDVAIATLRQSVSSHDVHTLEQFHRVMHDLDYWLVNYPVGDFKSAPPDWHGVYVYFGVLSYEE